MRQFNTSSDPATVILADSGTLHIPPIIKIDHSHISIKARARRMDKALTHQLSDLERPAYEVEGPRLSLWCFAGVDQALSYLSELDVQMLGSSPQDVKGLFGRDPFALHENPLGLADQLPSLQG